MSKKSHHFLMLWPWPLIYDLENLIRSGRYHYQCVYQIWEQSIPWFLSYHVNTIAGGGRLAVGSRRLRRKTITSPDPSDTGDIIRQNLHNRTRPRSQGYEYPCHISKWSVKIYGRESVNGDFPCAKLKNFFDDYGKTWNLYWLTCLDLPICQIWWL